MSYNTLQEYSSPSEEEQSIHSTVVHRRGPEAIYLYNETFLCKDDADLFLQNMLKQSCIKGREHNTSNARKRYVYCKYRNNASCPKEWVFVYPHDDVKVYLHEKDCDHNDLPFETSRGLSDQLKAIINECVERGQAKPKQIIAEMRRSGISGTNEPENLRQKISTYVAYQKKKRYGESGFTVADLYQFCSDNEKDPQLKDQCYVIGYEFPEDIGLDGVSKIRILLSSKRLLDHTPSTICSQIHADKTYKLLWQGYPVFVIGSSDKRNVFHPIAIGVCGHENADDFEFIFNTLRNFGYNPEYLMCDDADAIRNGAKRVWSNIKCGMCFSHVFMNSERSSKILKDQNLKFKVLDGIKTLQLSNTESELKKGFDLLSESLLEVSMDQDLRRSLLSFLDWFKKQWIDHNPFWFEGFNVLGPMNNSGLEGLNATIKEEGTLRERMGLMPYLNVLKELLHSWSLDRNPESPNCKFYQIELPPPDAKMFKKAYSFVKEKRKILTVEVDVNAKNTL